MNKYRLIACDLDGTLLNSEMKLSRENYRAIKELTKQGIVFVPTTGRTLCEMGEVTDLPEIRYMIYSNGSAILDKETDETISLGLVGENSRFVYNVLKKYDAFIVMHKNGQTCYDKEMIKRIPEFEFCADVSELVEVYARAFDDFEKEFVSGEIESVSGFFINEKAKDKCKEELSENPDLYVAEAWERNLEVFFKDAGKGNALKILTEKLGVDMQEVLSIGDSNNDGQMTAMSGLGLATANACESLKEIADEVICTNDEHVVKYVLQHYFK